MGLSDIKAKDIKKYFSLGSISLIISAVLIILKLTGVISCPWIITLLPPLVYYGVFVISILLIFIMVLIFVFLGYIISLFL